MRTILVFCLCDLSYGSIINVIIKTLTVIANQNTKGNTTILFIGIKEIRVTTYKVEQNNPSIYLQESHATLRVLNDVFFIDNFVCVFIITRSCHFVKGFFLFPLL